MSSDNKVDELSTKTSQISTCMSPLSPTGSLDSLLPELTSTKNRLQSPKPLNLLSETDERISDDSKLECPITNGILGHDDNTNCSLQFGEEFGESELSLDSCSNLRTKTVVPPPIESMMDSSIIEMMSSTLTEVIMHSEMNYGQVIHMSSDHSTHRNPKRKQNCITRTLSLDLDIPMRTVSETDSNTNPSTTDANDEDNELTLAEAITSKYLRTASTVLEDVPYNPNVIIVTPPKTLSIPATLVLNDCNITSVGELDQLKPICPRVRELDLAQNKLNDLCEVEKILSTMNRLTFLNLSSNNLSQGGKLSADTITVETMKWLVLNSTYIPWEGVELILTCTPNLEELYLSLNGYDCIALDENKSMQNIHLIHVSGNPISKWEDVIKLGHKFPKLETLVMADCQLGCIEQQDCIGLVFEKLQSLNVSNNQINSWDEIDKIRLFPSLVDIRLLGLPLVNRYKQQERRQLMIGRLPNIERLNGSRISEQEREDAERAFIRYYMQKTDKPSRFKELVEKHGHLDPLANVDMRPKKVVQVVVQYEEKREIRHVNVQQTIGSLKSSLHDFSGLTPNQMRLWYVDAEIRDFTGPEELRFNAKMLYTLNVQDGDEFHIIKKE